MNDYCERQIEKLHDVIVELEDLGTEPYREISTAVTLIQQAIAELRLRQIRLDLND